jgi:hypothetical protein
MLRRLLPGLLACALLAACSPEAPEKERKPEPQAVRPQVQSTEPAGLATPQDPIERARAVDHAREAADQQQRAAIEQAGG